MTLDTTGPNAQQIEYWNEQSGPKWVALESLLDQQIGPLGLAAIERAKLAARERALKIKLNAAGLGRDAFEVSMKLRNGEPRLWVNEKSLPNDVLLITAINLNQQHADEVGKRIREVLSGDD